MEYQVGDRIVHPQHGAGEISAVEKKRISGVTRSYFVMHISKGDIRLMIPTEACGQIGIRPVIGRDQAEETLRALPRLELTEEKNWNRRYRDYMAYVQSGEPIKVAAVIKALLLREAEKGLTNGERKMLHASKQILISELTLALDQPYETVEQRILLAAGVEAKPAAGTEAEA